MIVNETVIYQKVKKKNQKSSTGHHAASNGENPYHKASFQLTTVWKRIYNKRTVFNPTKIKIVSVLDNDPMPLVNLICLCIVIKCNNIYEVTKVYNLNTYINSEFHPCRRPCGDLYIYTFQMLYTKIKCGFLGNYPLLYIYLLVYIYEIIIPLYRSISRRTYYF